MSNKLTEILEQLQDMDLVSERGDTWRKSDIKQAEQAIQAYIAEVIGEDDIYGELSAEELSHRMKLRAEQRKRAGL